jgi:hypothetical protein
VSFFEAMIATALIARIPTMAHTANLAENLALALATALKTASLSTLFPRSRLTPLRRRGHQLNRIRTAHDPMHNCALHPDAHRQLRHDRRGLKRYAAELDANFSYSPDAHPGACPHP